jgi:hypothetical protein
MAREERHLIDKGRGVVRWTRGDWIVRTSHAERIAFQAAASAPGDGQDHWIRENGLNWHWPRDGNDKPLDRWTDGADQRRRVLWGQESVLRRARRA